MEAYRNISTHLSFSCSKSVIEILIEAVKSVQMLQYKDTNNVLLMSLLITVGRFKIFF